MQRSVLDKPLEHQQTSLPENLWANSNGWQRDETRYYQTYTVNQRKQQSTNHQIAFGNDLAEKYFDSLIARMEMANSSVSVTMEEIHAAALLEEGDWNNDFSQRRQQSTNHQIAFGNDPAEKYFDSLIARMEMANSSVSGAADSSVTMEEIHAAALLEEGDWNNDFRLMTDKFMASMNETIKVLESLLHTTTVFNDKRRCQCSVAKRKRGQWTPEEDVLLVQLVNQMGRNWRKVREAFGEHRTEEQLRFRHKSAAKHVSDLTEQATDVGVPLGLQDQLSIDVFEMCEEQLRVATRHESAAKHVSDLAEQAADVGVPLGLQGQLSIDLFEMDEEQLREHFVII